MKLHFIAPLLFALFVHVYSTPIAKLEDPTKIAEGIIQEETQGVFKSASSEAALTSAVTTEAPKEASSTSAPTPASPEKLKETGRQSSDDDDDDDDDDDLDLGIEDDDDDDAADDDDEDDDYFERFFDDLLGEEDDDDDDSSPSTGSQQPVVVAAEPPEAPASNPQEELQSAGEEAIDGETENPVDGTESDSDNIVEKDPTDADASEQNSVQEPVVVQPVPAEDEDEDDDDDDDDDEPDLGDLAADDDDDDDDEDDETADDDDEDDDDDDEADLEDVLEAKRSRAMQQTGPKMPPVYISKYNRFVDSIINRINRILGKSYDPVRVKIHSSTTKKNKTKSSSKKNKNKTKRTKTKATTKSTGNVAASTTSAPTNKIGEISLARMTESESREPAFVLVSKTSSRKPSMPNETTATTTKKTRRKSNKGKAEKKSTKPRATLFGLSSIKRDGDVSVNMMADHTTVKTNFLVGPLTLRVEREFGKGARKELKSATATTAQMHGKLSLKIKQGGIATLHSLKVMQPKQVRVESPDNHEKTKEYMWKKSGNIATVVAQKLASATRSMLQPPPAA